MKLKNQNQEGSSLELFIKGLAEIGINKTLIENEYLFTKLAKEEHKMPESQSDDGSDSSVAESDDSDDEKESVNESIQCDSDEEMESNSEKLTCHHCEKDHAHMSIYWHVQDVRGEIFTGTKMIIVQYVTKHRR